MRIAALTALLGAFAWAQGAEEPARELKVLGFTLGEPPPEDAVLEEDGGRYKEYTLVHRWCRYGVDAITENNRVMWVSCQSKRGCCCRC